MSRIIERLEGFRSRGQNDADDDVIRFEPVGDWPKGDIRESYVVPSTAVSPARLLKIYEHSQEAKAAREQVE